MTTVAANRFEVAQEHEAAVRRHVSLVAITLSGRLGEVAVEMRDLLAERIDELDAEPVLLDLMLASIEGNVVTILQALQHDIGCERQEPPTAAIEYARRLAQRGVPVYALVRAYRLGQQFLLRRAFDTSTELGGGEDVRAEAYDRIVQQVFDYIDWISQRVVVVYEEERETWLAHQSNARQGTVRRLLDGGDVDLVAAERALGYRLSSVHHLAVVAWTSTPAEPGDHLGGSIRTIREFAEEIGGGAPLVVDCDQATAWAWVPVPRDWRFDEGLAGWRSVGRPGTVLAVGSSRPGVEGFRRSHAEALRVHRLVSLGGVPDRSVVSHDEPGVAATSLLAQDLPGTRAWVRGVLGDLIQEGESTARLRSTLLTLLRHDMSYTATAEAMVMHKNSIRYRLTSAEAMLGHRVTENRLDVELALTACTWLGRAVLE